MVRVLPAPGPVRQLALVTLVNTTGNGIFYTLSALYFTRILGFSVVSVGAGLDAPVGTHPLNSSTPIITGAARVSVRSVRRVRSVGIPPSSPTTSRFCRN